MDTFFKKGSNTDSFTFCSWRYKEVHRTIRRYYSVGSVKSGVHNDTGVSGIDWKHYKHPLPEHVYDVYMRYWSDVKAHIDQAYRLVEITRG